MFGNQRPREKTIKEQSDGAQTTGMYCVIVQKKRTNRIQTYKTTDECRTKMVVKISGGNFSQVLV